MVDIKAASNVDDNIANPFAPALYTFSTFHCMTVSLGLGGDGLGTVWGRQLATLMLHHAGFSPGGGVRRRGGPDQRILRLPPLSAAWTCLSGAPSSR